MIDKSNDICRKKLLDEEIEEKIWLLSTIIDSSPDISIFVLDKEYNYLFFNQKYKDIMKSIGRNNIEIGMNALNAIYEDEDRNKLKKSFDKSLGGEPFDTIDQYKNEKLNGFFWRNYFAPLRSKKDEVIGLTCFVLNITDRKIAEIENEKILKEKNMILKELQEKNEMLKILSETDDLTGLKNKKYILDRIEMQIAKSNRYDYVFSIIVIDIDKFKKINDNYGHLIGDEVLETLGKKIKNSLRKVDEVGRFGGEEFIVLLPHINKEDGFKVAEKIRKNIADLQWGFEVRITISSGVAQYSNETKESLINRADKKLYEAKKSGRNKTEV
ncbi:sensor domain-containing diguanylate cyclase [Clostridium grantii]|uniref:PAS domain S-box-containing protein/diguanylate cyclase (GGDEF) domain-containing protein n=1 Tax=Clostridium grantii DSM 8605 TaxID=1121316 RepID=A0A1M5WFC3_9CLOT|nr:sensor domain-containing diguanylate cyclase [Clostridium grantii]SHH85943.1 PAS domain S-box-containing protein/diguanylate cyclase (GGDEF) domain-containing protein [Clostridium grantii DSM 8605]